MLGVLLMLVVAVVAIVLAAPMMPFVIVGAALAWAFWQLYTMPWWAWVIAMTVLVVAVRLHDEVAKE